jgi:hypothetical protein
MLLQVLVLIPTQANSQVPSIMHALFKDYHYHHNENSCGVPEISYTTIAKTRTWVSVHWWHCSDQEGDTPPMKMKYLECLDIDFLINLNA